MGFVGKMLVFRGIKKHVKLIYFSIFSNYEIRQKGLKTNMTFFYIVKHVFKLKTVLRWILKSSPDHFYESMTYRRYISAATMSWIMSEP